MNTTFICFVLFFCVLMRDCAFMSFNLVLQGSPYMLERFFFNTRKSFQYIYGGLYQLLAKYFFKPVRIFKSVRLLGTQKHLLLFNKGNRLQSKRAKRVNQNRRQPLAFIAPFLRGLRKMKLSQCYGILLTTFKTKNKIPGKEVTWLLFSY